MDPNGDGTATLRLGLDDESAPLFRLELLAPTPEQAEVWARSYRTDPSALYLGPHPAVEPNFPKGGTYP